MVNTSETKVVVIGQYSVTEGADGQVAVKRRFKKHDDHIT